MRLSIRIVLLFLCLISFRLSAQTIPTDLSKVDVEQLTDDQILEISKRFETSGIPEEEGLLLLQQRGLTAEDAALLKTRMTELRGLGQSSSLPPSQDQKGNVSFSRDTLYLPPVEHAPKESKIYGADFFSNPQLSFQPDIRIATPKNYTLGPDDELIVMLTGLNESTVTSKVTPDGNVKIPYAGLVYVNGLSIEQATAQIRAKMQSIYPGLSNGQTKLVVSLGSVRSIRVNIIGEVVQPGTYTLSSLSSVFNALYQSGGPTQNGSLRNIELVRGNQVIQTIDFYSFLQKGYLDENVRLEDQDVIRVPMYEKRITIAGEVKRPGIYELKTHETLQDLLGYVGGFSDNAYKALAKLSQIGDTERSVKDVSSDNFDRYILKNADSVYFGPVLNRYTNRVIIEGAVYRPGVFELTEGLSLKDLIAKADGLREDASLRNAYIKRTHPDLNKELISVNLKEIMNGGVADIPLFREDSVVISSIQELKDVSLISIGGHVRAPGQFTYREGMKVGDLITMAKGFSDDAARHRVEISRMIKNSSDQVSNQIMEVITLNLDSNQSQAAFNFALDPLDQIYVPRLVNYKSLGSIKIRGEVLFPGDYVQQRRDETGPEYIARAGGITPEGSLENAQIFRKGIRLNMDLVNEKGKLPKSAQILLPGDSIYIPQEIPFVEVAGEVNNPQYINYTSKSFTHYVDAAGGTTENARLKGAYVQYANGLNKPVKRFLFFKNYPTVTPGSKIIVPKKGPSKLRLGFGEISAITSSLAAVVSMIALIVK